MNAFLALFLLAAAILAGSAGAVEDLEGADVQQGALRRALTTTTTTTTSITGMQYGLTCKTVNTGTTTTFTLTANKNVWIGVSSAAHMIVPGGVGIIGLSTTANPGKTAVAAYDFNGAGAPTFAQVPKDSRSLASIGITKASFKSTATSAILTFTVTNGKTPFTINTGSNALMFALGPYALFNSTHGPSNRVHFTITV